MTAAFSAQSDDGRLRLRSRRWMEGGDSHRSIGNVFSEAVATVQITLALARGLCARGCACARGPVSRQGGTIVVVVGGSWYNSAPGVKFVEVRDGLCKWSEGTGCENLMQFD